jgi:hypothetical protein
MVLCQNGQQKGKNEVRGQLLRIATKYYYDI